MQIAKIQTTQFYKKIIIIFIVVTLLLFGVIVYFSFSKTVILVSLNPQPTSTAFSIEIAEDDQPTTNTLPGYLVATTKNGSKTFTNTNTGEEVLDNAAGTVTIYNNWSQEQPLAATTRLLAPDGTLFRIKDRVDVPAGGTLENVAVYADQPGPSGDIEPTTFTIPGLWEGLQDKIYAQSFEQMSGGLRSAKVLTQDQINEATETLRQELEEQARAELARSDKILENNDTLSKQAVTSIILENSPSAEVGAEAEAFELTMTIRAVGIIFDEAELLGIAKDLLEKDISADEKISSYDQSGLMYTLETYDLEQQTAELEVDFTAAVAPRLSNAIFERDNVTAKDEQQIKSYFSKFDSIGEVEVKFSPFWVTKAPKLKDHIEIKIAE